MSVVVSNDDTEVEFVHGVCSLNIYGRVTSLPPQHIGSHVTPMTLQLLQ